jgi:PPP family 3-phenylpropionic acid transporter
MSIPYWRLSSFYFLYFATLGGFIPYWSLYLKDFGFDPIEIGELSALLVGTKIIAPNISGWIADHTGKSIGIIRLAAFLATVIFAGFLWVHNYVSFALITISFSFFWNAMLPQFEAVTLAHLRNAAHRYSRIRLWGSIGFIVAVLSIGAVLEYYPVILLPLILAALLLLNAVIVFVTPEAKSITLDVAVHGMLKIIKMPEVLAFMAVNVLLQIAHAPYYVFYSIYLKHAQYSAMMTGLLWALGVLAEIVLFMYMRNLLTFCSLRAILLLSLALATARWLMIGWGSEYLWVLIVAQLFHAATFGGTHVVAMYLLQRYFGDHHQGKGQALYTSLCFGLGGMLGSLYSGYYWDLVGSRIVFSMAAACCGLAFIIAYVWVARENTQDKALIG